MKRTDRNSVVKLPDLNSCTARILVRDMGLSAAMARDIMTHKRKKGRFEHIGELWQLDKMTPSMFEFISANYTVYNLPKIRNRQNRSRVVTLKSVKGNNNSSKQSNPKVKIEDTSRNFDDAGGLFPPNGLSMNPVAVATSPSGNALTVTYRAADAGLGFRQGIRHFSKLLDSGTQTDGTAGVSRSGVNQAVLDRQRTGGAVTVPLTEAHLKYIEASQVKPSRRYSIERWVSGTRDPFLPSTSGVGKTKPVAETTKTGVDVGSSKKGHKSNADKTTPSPKKSSSAVKKNDVPNDTSSTQKRSKQKCQYLKDNFGLISTEGEVKTVTDETKKDREVTLDVDANLPSTSKGESNGRKRNSPEKGSPKSRSKHRNEKSRSFSKIIEEHKTDQIPDETKQEGEETKQKSRRRHRKSRRRSRERRRRSRERRHRDGHRSSRSGDNSCSLM